MEQHDPETGEIVDVRVNLAMPASIIKARLAVMKAAKGVGKSGRNAFHGYDYASDEDVLGLIQPLMAEHGLLLEMRPTAIDFDTDGNARVCFDMVWMHESGAVAPPIPWWGIASDRDKQGRMQDKWFNKAATAAEKYFLLKQFHIPAGKNADPDADETERVKPTSRPAPPKPKPEPVPPLAPRSIIVPNGEDKQKNWKSWVGTLKRHISAATLDEVDGWLDQNRPQLDRLELESKAAYDHLMEHVDEHKSQLEADMAAMAAE